MYWARLKLDKFLTYSIIIEDIINLKISIEKAIRLLWLKVRPLIKEYGINLRELKNISIFLYNFTFKTTQMAKDINFKIFKKLLKKKKFRKIVIDQIMMLEYNILWLFTMDKVSTSEYE